MTATQPVMYPRTTSVSALRSEVTPVVLQKLEAAALDRSPAAIAEAELARALLAREPGAPAEAWRRFAPAVSRFLQRALGPAHDAADLTQEVFLRFFTRVSRLEDPHALRSYLFSIAVRVLRWELRRLRLQRLVGLTDTGFLPELISAPEPEARQALSRFYDTLGKLNPDTRSFFVLRHMEGWRTEDIAATMGVSLATAKRRLRAALALVNRLVERDPALSGYASEILARSRGDTR